MKKKLVWLLVLVAALLVCTVALADWEVENGTYLVYRDKGKLKTGSVKIDGVTYTFDANGHLVYTDSAVKIGGSVYYVKRMAPWRPAGCRRDTKNTILARITGRFPDGRSCRIISTISSRTRPARCSARW